MTLFSVLLLLFVWPKFSQQLHVNESGQKSSFVKNKTSESESETDLEFTNPDDRSSKMSSVSNESIKESFDILTKETELVNVLLNFLNDSNDNNFDNLIFEDGSGSGSGDFWSGDNSTDDALEEPEGSWSDDNSTDDALEEHADSWSNDSLFSNETSNSEHQMSIANLAENETGDFRPGNDEFQPQLIKDCASQ